MKTPMRTCPACHKAHPHKEPGIWKLRRYAGTRTYICCYRETSTK